MTLIRFALRTLSVIALAVATILAVLDATRSIAASKLVLTPLGQSWSDIAPSSLAAAKQAAMTHAPWLWDPVVIGILALPGFLVFLVLALVLQALGSKPKRFRGPSAA
ncbi:MAG TPA: hypothetical protein VHC00_15725 [Rhizobiaceae bacterium]|nr:hypothetical protein [Rhizobiaceae bacterium]